MNEEEHRGLHPVIDVFDDSVDVGEQPSREDLAAATEPTLSPSLHAARPRLSVAQHVMKSRA